MLVFGVAFSGSAPVDRSVTVQILFTDTMTDTRIGTCIRIGQALE
ncbi:Hypothetical protein Cul210932_1360 [Corynebacterium ulcerans]|nr:Hypothetical protein Cul210932_1360 [Corynebacterium ulcerans]